MNYWISDAMVYVTSFLWDYFEFLTVFCVLFCILFFKDDLRLFRDVSYRFITIYTYLFLEAIRYEQNYLSEMIYLRCYDVY